jgi:hypothetical protein
MSDAMQLLERFGLIPEEDLAKLLGVTVRTLQNRPRTNLPAFVKAGRRRLYKEDSVRAYLEARVIES